VGVGLLPFFMAGLLFRQHDFIAILWTDLCRESKIANIVLGMMGGGRTLVVQLIQIRV